MKLKSILSAAIVIAAVTSMSNVAQAGCGPGDGSPIGLQFKNLAIEVAQEEANFHGAVGNRTIVGLWKVAFTADDGTPVDAGFQTWHDDGTELMNSGRPPITGSYCMGVWKMTGVRSYKLNHFALPWTTGGFTQDGMDNIKMDVELGQSGDTFSGTFDLYHYDNDENLIFHLHGTVSGLRLTVE